MTQKGLKTLFRNMPKDIYGGKNHLRGFIIDDIESRLLFSSDLNEDMDPLIYQQVYNKITGDQ